MKHFRKPAPPRLPEIDPELGLRVTEVERNEAGYWQAKLTINGKTIDVDRRFGSWRITPEQENGPYQPLLSPFTDVVQARVRTLERSEAKKEAMTHA